MRVIAGSLGGRLFEAAVGHRTHPMSDKMRGALFNALGDLSGLTILDAFAGTGALSFEAVSRGAASALAIDNDRQAQVAIARNIESLGVTNVTLVTANAGGWSNKNRNVMFDIVLADPPYNKPNYDLLEKLVRHSKGLFVLSWPGKVEVPKLRGLELLSQKTHGDAQLLFYKTLAK